MTAHEIAKELGINPQTVLRVIRTMKKEYSKFFENVEKTGITKPVYNFNNSQAETVRTRVFLYSRKFKDPVLPKASTAAQRREWFAEWKGRLENANRVQWRSIAGIMGLIFLTSDPDFLQRPMLIGRVGDHIVDLIEEILIVLLDADPNSFLLWLHENGFYSVNTVL